MSVADDCSRSAKAINHWDFSEMVTNENGQYRWRSQQEQSMRQYNEMTKANVGRLLREGNRLAFGQHYNVTDDEGNTVQRWRFSPAGLEAVGESLGRGMNDSLKKNLINTNWVKHMLANEDQVKALEKTMEEQISLRPEEAAEIKESFRRLLNYTSPAGEDGFDPNAVVLKGAKKVGGFG
ncbi:hypothetical protein KKF29_02935, partial [Patescibacteria group bacterium]|nr:hypothetical protein [Patescibacteria group bacterium]